MEINSFVAVVAVAPEAVVDAFSSPLVLLPFVPPKLLLLPWPFRPLEAVVLFLSASASSFSHFWPPKQLCVLSLSLIHI